MKISLNSDQIEKKETKEMKKLVYRSSVQLRIAHFNEPSDSRIPVERRDCALSQQSKYRNVVAATNLFINVNRWLM